MTCNISRQKKNDKIKIKRWFLFQYYEKVIAFQTLLTSKKNILIFLKNVRKWTNWLKLTFLPSKIV